MKCPGALLPILFFAPPIALAACISKRGASQEIATDLHQYTAEMQKWEPKEKAIFQTIDDVEESQYVDDEFVLRTLKGTLPALDEHVREVTAYRPSTPELSRLHDHYGNGWEDLRGALDVMIAAENEKDYLALARGRGQMREARAKLLQTFAGMDALMEENDEMRKHGNKS